MTLKTTSFDIKGPLLIHGTRHHDERGYFSETYQKAKFSELGLPDFVQDNLSSSGRGVFRGLHWQDAPHGQGKLVTCISGSIIDYVVDIREGSPTYLRSLAVPLSSASLDSFWVPEGFAHGFLSLEEATLVSYKVTSFWHGPSEKSLNFRTLDTPLPFGFENLILSAKDEVAPTTIVHKQTV